MFLTKKTVVCVIVFMGLSIFLGCSGDKSGKHEDVPFGVNLIKNPSFEEWSDSIPDGWETRIIDELSSEGELVNRLKRSSEDTSGNYSCCFQSHDSTDKWMALVQVVPVTEGNDLLLSADVKTEYLQSISSSTYSNLFVRFLDEKRERLPSTELFCDVVFRRNVGTKPWRRYRKRIIIPPDVHFVEVGLLSTMSGAIYFDNVEAVMRKKIQWVKHDSKFITYYNLPDHPFPEGAVERGIGAVENYANRIELKEISKKISYYYYDNEEDFKRIHLARKYYQGVNWEQRELHTMNPEEDLIITHMLLYDYGFPPLGLAKGLVFYLRSYTHGWDPHKEAKEDLINHKLQPLFNSISSEKLQSSDLSTTIPAWTSFCTYLIGQYGLEKFIMLYKESSGIKNPKPFVSLFERIYEREFNKVDLDWRLFVMRYEPKGESVPMP